MNNSQIEILDIAQEEAAEVIVAISKVSRFGLETVHKGRNNRAHLEEEAGDLLCMLRLMNSHGLVDWANVELAATAKLEKLKQWSNIEI